jgi:hypothetical protein
MPKRAATSPGSHAVNTYYHEVNGQISITCQTSDPLPMNLIEQFTEEARRRTPPVVHDEAKFSDITVGGIYEDCSFHPCVCIRIKGDDIEGISLIDGSAPRSCSLAHCGPTALTVSEAVSIKGHFQQYTDLRSKLEAHEAASQLT